MPIDASIISRLMPAQVQAYDPLASAQKSLALQHLMGQQDMQGLQLRQAEQSASDQARLRTLLGSNPKDLEGELLRGGFVDQSLKIGKDRRENAKLDADTKKAAADAEKNSFETKIKQLEHGAAILDSARDQASWDSALRIGSMTGVFSPEFMQKMQGQPFNPQVVEQLKAAGLDRAKQLADQRAREQQAETGRHNKETERAGLISAGAAASNARTAADRLTFDKAQPKMHFDSERGVLVDERSGTAKPVTMGAVPIGAKDKLTDSQKKELASIDSQQNILKGALSAVKATPDAFGMTRGLATMAGAIPESLAGKMDSPDQREARSYVFNVVSKVINERAGAAQSAQELARLRSFLPAETDNADQIKDKLTSFNSYLENSRAGYNRTQTANASQPARIADDAGYNALPSGSQYVGPDGVLRRKP